VMAVYYFPENSYDSIAEYFDTLMQLGGENVVR